MKFLETIEKNKKNKEKTKKEIMNQLQKLESEKTLLEEDVKLDNIGEKLKEIKIDSLSREIANLNGVLYQVENDKIDYTLEKIREDFNEYLKKDKSFINAFNKAIDLKLEYIKATEELAQEVNKLEQYSATIKNVAKSHIDNIPMYFALMQMTGSNIVDLDLDIAELRFEDADILKIRDNLKKATISIASEMTL